MEYIRASYHLFMFTLQGLSSESANDSESRVCLSKVPSGYWVARSRSDESGMYDD